MRPISSPPKVSTSPVVTSAALTEAPATTCLETIALACSVVKLSRVPAGSLANASSDGAKIVTASTPFKVGTRPRSLTILTKVVNAPAPMATSTTFPTFPFVRAALGAAATPLLFMLFRKPEISCILEK